MLRGDDQLCDGRTPKNLNVEIDLRVQAKGPGRAMGDADKRLERIENRVEVLLERQRLSRFDNLMFLAYPLMIFSITLSMYMSVQYEALGTPKVWSLPLVELLEVLRVLLGLGLGLPFVVFLFAYGVDSLDLRLVSVALLALVILIPFGSSFAMVALFSILGTVIDVATISVTSVIVLVPFLFSAMFLLLEAAFRIVDRVGSWFKRTMQISLKEGVVSMHLHLPPKVPVARLGVKASWSAGLLAFITVLVIATCRGQVSGRTVYDALYVTAFLIVTEAIMLWRL